MLGAAGAVEMAICAKAIQTNIVPPTINYEHPDPECDLDYVRTPLGKCPVHAVLNNSFGFGGHNATVVARKFCRIKDVYMNPSSAYLPRHGHSPTQTGTNAQALVGCQTSRSSGGRVFRHLSAGMRVTEVGLEEVEPTGDEKYWLVTLGFDSPRKNLKLPDFLHIPVRKLKVFKVDARTGKVVAMKIAPRNDFNLSAAAF